MSQLNRLTRVLLMVGALACGVSGGAARADVTFTTIAELNTPVGIDWQPVTGNLLVSVNWFTGLPHVYEYLDPATGIHTPFVPQVNNQFDEIYFSIAKDTLGGFQVGEILAGTGTGGQIARIAADGSSVNLNWVQLPGETRRLRGGLEIDRTGVFDGDLLVAAGSKDGTGTQVWRVTSAGVVVGGTPLATLGDHLEGLTIVPNDPRYGPFAGTLLAGAEDAGGVYTIRPNGTTQFFPTVDVNGRQVKVEDLGIVPPNHDFYGVDVNDAKPIGTVVKAEAAQLTGYVGDILFADEGPGEATPGILYRARWLATGLVIEPIGQVAQWEHITFVPVPSEHAGGRMTGGGSVFTADGRRVTHGFQLHCDIGDAPNSLEVNWKGIDGAEHRFHLAGLTFALCLDDPAIGPAPPQAGFDTLIARGVGRLDGVAGATIEFVFTDAGEPGRNDTALYLIRDVNGNVVLSVAASFLDRGNHQAHK